MYRLEKIDTVGMDEFFKAHIKYLVEDEIITDKEDIEYFSSETKYRQVIRELMQKPSPIEAFWIYQGNEKIGATHFKVYHLTDGECFILDFWIFPEYRNQGRGTKAFECLEAYARDKGATYFKLNSEKADSIKFWKRLGFVYEGKDEEGMNLYIKH